MEIKLTRIGGSAGVALPNDVFARLGVGPGGSLYLTESPGSYQLTSCDPESAQQLAIADRIMKRRRRALRKLAK